MKRNMKTAKTKPVLGIELGSTRIKAVLIDEAHKVIAQGSHDWSSELKDGLWTYDLEQVEKGIQEAYRALADDYRKNFGEELRELSALGVSAMMHGYLAFNEQDELLVPFRTWQNTNTAEASAKLSKFLEFNMPLRWSVSHYYQAILNGEEHVPEVAYLTTLAGYVHLKLTGRKVLGVGDAAGMFPVTEQDGGRSVFDAERLKLFNALPEVQGLPRRLEEILPEVLRAGDEAGTLTEEGALYLDPSGTLQPGAAVCPPEGDAGTGMTATNTVAVRTGNVSVGTSIFAMIVLEKALKSYYPEIDIVATPDGLPAAMVHCNNGTGELDAWVSLLAEFAAMNGLKLSKGELYHQLYHKALEASADAGGVLAYNFKAGEPIAKTDSGRPMYLRRPDSELKLADFLLAQLYAINASLRMGMDILIAEEGVKVDKLLGHGGVFKTPEVMQKIMASCLRIPMAVFPTAGEGGAWGIAVLAAYAVRGRGQSLSRYLNEEVFNSIPPAIEEKPDAARARGFEEYLESFKESLPAARLAAEKLNKENNR